MFGKDFCHTYKYTSAAFKYIYKADNPNLCQWKDLG